MMTGENPDILNEAKVLFTVHEMIGSGSFSNVYRVTDKQTNKELALKVFKRKKNDVNQYARAACEMGFLKLLHHPNIILFDCCALTKQHIHMAVEYSPFGSLASMTNRDKIMAETYVQKVMKQLLLALDYLHKLNICHGDVKPENVIVTKVIPDVVIKLSDFGLAEVLMEKERDTRKGGSFYYMAPELHLKFPFDVTIDLFSAGIVMFELLFGKKPFPKNVGKDAHISFLRKRSELVRASDLQERKSSISDCCIDLLKKLLDYDKHQRPRGDSLKKHRFLEIVEPTLCYQNHYIRGCECIIRSFDLARQNKIGQAFTEVNEGILRLKIYTMSIKTDPVLFKYMLYRISDYSMYCEHLEGQLVNETLPAPITLTMQNEQLRCLLSTTTKLLTGYDICCLGEMYVQQHQVPVGLKTLKEGIAILLHHVVDEPLGERRNRLAVKIQQWIELVENLEGRFQDAIAAGANF